MAELSVLIPARDERWLPRTIDSVLDRAAGDTEVIAVLDGYTPDPPIRERTGLRLIRHDVSIGQRAAVNEAARAATGRYVMKLDAHCDVAPGFDVALLEPYESGEISQETTTIPRMYNLHVFDWVCEACGHRYYQADPVPACLCGGTAFRIEEVWQPRLHKKTDFARFDHTMHFHYWRKYHTRPEAQGEIADVMSSVGACFVMPRERFFALGGMDEGHGSWGQFGTEVSCKAWLSGGRQVVNKRTWFSHFFRVGKLRFPYALSGEAQERARVYSREMWLQDRWPGAVRPLAWLVDKFKPAPGWHDPEGAEALATVLASGRAFSRVA